ncbi:MAG TPA: glycosyltransferase [Gaiellaceae bacterium]|nr:glycosyltransferase [Gaiellaceae bacterium]
MNVAICIPTYDERENIERMLRTLRAAYPDARLVVIDDSSPDGTGAIAEQLASELGGIDVLHRETKAGIGPAYVAGMRHALEQGADLVVTMDCDFSHDPADVARLLARGARDRLVVGSRYVAGGSVARWGLLRRALSRGGSLYAQLVLGLRVRDLTAGFKCYGRTVLESLDLDRIDARGYGFQIETTYRAAQAGYNIVEMPIAFTDRTAGRSKMSPRIAVEAMALVPRLRATRSGVVAAVLAVIAVAARLPRVWSDSLWQDEVASARILRQPTFGAMLHRVVRTESTPPLWYSLGWLLHTAGASILDVRLISVAAGGATAAMVVLLARDVLPLRLAAIAGLLAAFGNSALAHGHELRAYALLAALSTAFAVLLMRAVRTRRLADHVALAGCTAAGLLTHYFFCFTALAALAWLIGEPELRGRRRAPLTAVLLGAAATLPWLPDALTQIRADRYWWIGPFHLREVVVTPLRQLVPVPASPSFRLACGIAFLALCTLGAVRLARASARGRLLVVLAAGPLVLAAVAWSAGQRIYAPRNLIEIAPFVGVLAVASLVHLPRHARSFAAAAAAAALAVGFFTFGTRAVAAPFGPIARTLVREGWNHDDPIAVFGGQPEFFSFRSPLEWYLPRQPQLALGRPTDESCETLFAVVRSPRRARQLTELGGAESHWIDGYDVLRLRLRNPRAESALGRPSLITATTGHASCVAPVLAGRDGPLA